MIGFVMKRLAASRPKMPGPQRGTDMKKRILILISTLIILIQIYLLAVLAISALYPISRINEEDLSYLRQKTEGIRCV